MRTSITLGMIALAMPLTAALAAEPTADDIVRALQPKPGEPRTRAADGLINLDGTRGTSSPARDRGVSVSLEAKPESPPSVDLAVNFAFNSAELTTDAEITLSNLGQALGDARLAGYRFKIEGHTDSVGSDAYNLALSDRRAASVKTYLVRHHAIDPARLDAVGYGERRLADPGDPEAAINRRVRVVNVGTGGD